MVLPTLSSPAAQRGQQQPQAGPHPTLMHTVMAAVASAARGGQPLCDGNLQLLQLLFPSAAGITATLPSADGLGVAVVPLLAQQPAVAPAGAGGAATPKAAPAAKLTQPLPAGGVLTFSLAAAHLPAAEQQLMQAFATELCSRLQPHWFLDHAQHSQHVQVRRWAGRLQQPPTAPVHAVGSYAAGSYCW